MRKTAILILSVLLFSYGLPLANAATETQFTDGTSTFTHVFSQAGDSPTPGVTLPYGADVQNVEFEIEGSASTSTWLNRTTNSDFGGAGTTGSSQQGQYLNQYGWYYMYKQNVKVENNEVELRPTETTTYWDMTTPTMFHPHLVEASTRLGTTTRLQKLGTEASAILEESAYPVELGAIISEPLLNNLTNIM